MLISCRWEWYFNAINVHNALSQHTACKLSFLHATAHLSNNQQILYDNNLKTKEYIQLFFYFCYKNEQIAFLPILNFLKKILVSFFNECPYPLTKSWHGLLRNEKENSKENIFRNIRSPLMFTVGKHLQYNSELYETKVWYISQLVKLFLTLQK